MLVSDELIARLPRDRTEERRPGRTESVRRVEDRGKYSWLEIVLTEGKNREVRRLLEAVGLNALKLVRTRIGPCTLEGLQVGNGAICFARRFPSFLKSRIPFPELIGSNSCCVEGENDSGRNRLPVFARRPESGGRNQPSDPGEQRLVVRMLEDGFNLCGSAAVDCGRDGEIVVFPRFPRTGNTIAIFHEIERIERSRSALSRLRLHLCRSHPELFCQRPAHIVAIFGTEGIESGRNGSPLCVLGFGADIRSNGTGQQQKEHGCDDRSRSPRCIPH